MYKYIGGTKGNNKYALENVIGKGSFGKVYKCGQYAVKEISTKGMSPYMIQSLNTQVKILRRLNSPYIVSLIDVLSQNGYVYLVMQYCPMDMKTFIQKNKLDEKRCKNILKQILLGFSLLIKQNIIHRDLKPANILVNSNAEFKLADFGYAKIIEQQYTNKLLQSCVGTPLYMAPQLLKQQKYTTKCDIWSIGVIYYQLLTKYLPWEGKSILDLSKNIERQPLKIPNHISDWSANILKRMLTINQNDRIGWQQLLRIGIQGDQLNPSQQDTYNQRERSRSRSESRTTVIFPKSQKKISQNANNINVKTSDLLALFEIELLEFYSQEKAHKMMTQKNYRRQTKDYQNFKKILNGYNPSFRKFIEGYFQISL